MSLPFLSQTDPTLFTNKRVLVRIDANIPIGSDGVVDRNEMYRLDAIIPTIEFLRKSGAQITLISHHGGKDDTQSLAPIISYFAQQNITLLENLRLNPGEKKNDPAFAQELTRGFDLFVNDAFSASHREHASIVGIPKLLPSYLGFQFEKEITYLEPLTRAPQGLAVILGGAKFSTKLDLMKKFLEKNVPIFLGGALAHAIYKARGDEIGKSFYDIDADVHDIYENHNITVPEYVVIENTSAQRAEKSVTEVSLDESILDMGPTSYSALAEFIQDKKVILWNGPLGWYEKGYIAGTVACAHLLATATVHGTQTIIGGGDTITVLQQNNIPLTQFSFASTGGGAMLDYLIQGTLPGITAVQKQV